MTQKEPIIIEQFFKELNADVKNNNYTELFNPENENIDLQTDLTDSELRYIAVLKTNDDYLENLGVGSIYNKYVNHFMRLKVSKDRQSRKEYVEVNKNENDIGLQEAFGKMGIGANK